MVIIMGFWVFMTICNFMIPVFMIVIGKIFMKNPPRTINEIYGYRTSRSRKNQDTWNLLIYTVGNYGGSRVGS